MDWLEKLKRLKALSKMSTKEIAQASGIPEPTLEKIFAGATKNPGLSTIQALVHALGYTLDDIDHISVNTKKAPSVSDEAMKLAKDYDGLDSYGRRIVRLMADEEKARCAELAKKESETDTVIYITRWFPHPMSAGTGTEAGDDYPDELELTKRPPRGTSYVAPVSGDSMEPTYHDGDKLFVRSCEEINIGQIGVFLMDGQQWVKEQGDGVLISHNGIYDPIPMRDGIRCQGLVLGVCNESYFE